MAGMTSGIGTLTTQMYAPGDSNDANYFALFGILTDAAQMVSRTLPAPPPYGTAGRRQHGTGGHRHSRHEHGSAQWVASSGCVRARHPHCAFFSPVDDGVVDDDYIVIIMIDHDRSRS